MKTRTQIKEALRLCYVVANNIRKKKFHSEMTNRHSIFGNDVTFSTKNKLIGDFRYQANQALSIKSDQPVPLTRLLILGADLIEDTCNGICEYMDIEIAKKEQKSVCKDYIEEMAGVREERQLSNIMGVLNEMDQQIYCINTFYVSNFIVELARTCKALSTIHKGTMNSSFNNLIRECLKRDNYFSDGYPKDLLCYDAWAVESGKVHKIYRKPEYCSTATNDQPDAEYGYVGYEIEYEG